VDEGKLSVPLSSQSAIDAEYPGNSCYLLQDVVENIFYREKEAREVLEYDYKQLAYECDKHIELRIASDRDLVNCYKSLQKLNEDCEKLRAQLKELEEAALPIARLPVPHPSGPKIAPLVDWLRESPT
jgi:hypothetical protein